MAATEKTLNTEDILSSKEIDELREQLETEKQRIIDMYDHDIRAGQAASDEGTEDLVDQANKAYNREFLFHLSNSERQALLEIESALQRMAEGTYGFCLHSGKPIAVQRLMAVPWARYCIEYQELAEKGLLEDPEDRD